MDIDDELANKLKIQKGTLELSLELSKYWTFEEYLKNDTYALDIILSQTAMKSKMYVPCGIGKLFQSEKKELGQGLETHEGCMKKIYHSNASSKSSYFLSMDHIQHSFFPCGVHFLEAWKSFSNGTSNDNAAEDFSKLYANVKLQVIKKFTKIVTFRKLDEQDKNRAITDSGTYKLDELRVVPYQIVDGERIPENLHVTEATLNLLDRKHRQTIIQNQCNNLFSNGEEYLKKFGIKITKEMLKCGVTTYEKPDIIVGGRKILKLGENGTISYGKEQYILPASPRHWILRTDSADCEELATKIMDTIKFRGVEIQAVHTEEIEWETFTHRSFFLHISHDNNWSDEMKNVNKKTNVITKHIQWKENLSEEILASEINQILGGWCHNVKCDYLSNLSLEKIFVIAVHAQFCYSTKNHLFVGISANISAEHPYKFCGHSFIQEGSAGVKWSTKSVNADTLKTIIKKMLQSESRKFNKVIYLRNEVAKNYLKMEMDCIKNGIPKINCASDIKFFGMIVHKEGKVRHFYKYKDEITNVPLYSVIPFDKQTFFMVSTTSNKDSVKACEINVVESDEGSFGNIQKFLMTLTTLNQSVFPSGLPAPSMISKKCSKIADFAFADNNKPSAAALEELNKKLCPFL